MWKRFCLLFFLKKGIFSIDLSLAKAESDSFCIAKKKVLKKYEMQFLFCLCLQHTAPNIYLNILITDRRCRHRFQRRRGRVLLCLLPHH